MRQTERSKSENTCQEMQELRENARNVNMGQQEATKLSNSMHHIFT